MILVMDHGQAQVQVSHMWQILLFLKQVHSLEVYS